MKKRTKKLLLLVLAAATSGCVPAKCPAGLTRMTEVDLFFGRSINGRGEVSQAEWTDFLARILTPKLPDGFTVFDAQGQWMNSRTGTIAHENTWVVHAVLPASSDISLVTNPITSAYRQRFHQQSVGETITETCAHF